MPTLFIDRDTWSHLLDSALRAAAIPFVAHREVFEPDTPDPEWIGEAGRRGWTVVTCDKNIRRRPNELRAVRAAKVRLFALTFSRRHGNRNHQGVASDSERSCPHVSPCAVLGFALRSRALSEIVTANWLPQLFKNRCEVDRHYIQDTLRAFFPLRRPRVPSATLHRFGRQH